MQDDFRAAAFLEQLLLILIILLDGFWINCLREMNGVWLGFWMIGWTVLSGSFFEIFEGLGLFLDYWRWRICWRLFRRFLVGDCSVLLELFVFGSD